jgi:AcrR family transcriptional regulator
MTEARLRRPPPLQNRAEAKRALVLEAAERLLETFPPSQVTTRKVAEAAGVPVGSVYRYFADADDLLAALFRRFNEETVAAVESLTGSSAIWQDELAGFFDVLKKVHMRHPSYGALMHHLGRQGEDERRIIRVLSDRLASAAPKFDEKLATEVAGTILVLIEGIERRYHGLRPEERSQVFGEGERAVRAYLATYLEPSV